jgi:hypothetical protein
MFQKEEARWGNGRGYFTGLSDQTAESLKSLEGADVCWVEEAQTLTDRSLQLLRPSIPRARIASLKVLCVLASKSRTMACGC